MRVLFHLLNPGVGGGQRMATLVAEELRARGDTVGLAVSSPGPTLDRFRAAGATTHLVDAGTLRRPFSAIALARILRDYDVLYSHTSAPGQMLGALAARLARRPQVVHHHTYPYFSTQARVRQLQTALFPFLLSHAEFIAVAAHVGQGLQEECGVAATRIHVIENGVSIPAIVPARAAGRLRIGMLARLDPGKGVHTFIEAVQSVRADVPADFVIGGEPGPFADYGNQMRKAALAAGVEMVEPGSDGLGLLETLDVVAMPSLYEGSPLVLLEAMSLGKAIIASDIPGIREVLEPHAAGVLVPPLDAVRLGSAMEELGTDEALRLELGARAREAVASRYSLETMLEKTLAVLDGTVRG